MCCSQVRDLLPFFFWFEYLIHLSLLKYRQSLSDHFNIFDFAEFIFQQHLFPPPTLKLKIRAAPVLQKPHQLPLFQKNSKTMECLTCNTLNAIHFYAIKLSTKVIFDIHCINTFNSSLPCTWFFYSCPSPNCIYVSHITYSSLALKDFMIIKVNNDNS